MGKYLTTICPNPSFEIGNFYMKAGIIAPHTRTHRILELS